MYPHTMAKLQTSCASPKYYLNPSIFGDNFFYCTKWRVGGSKIHNLKCYHYWWKHPNSHGEIFIIQFKFNQCSMLIGTPDIFKQVLLTGLNRFVNVNTNSWEFFLKRGCSVSFFFHIVCQMASVWVTQECCIV